MNPYYLIYLLSIPLIKCLIEFPFYLQSQETEDKSYNNVRFLSEHQAKLNTINYNAIIPDVLIGSPPQSISLLISMNSMQTWLIEDDKPTGYHRRKSYSYKLSHMQDSSDFIDQSFKRQELNDYFSIGNIQLQEYYFIVSDAIDSNHERLYNGAMGLGFNYKEKDLRFSFIEHAKRAKIISKSIYSFNMNNKSNGIFSIGDYPNELTDTTRKYYHTCPLITHIDNQPNIQWNCFIDSIYISDLYELYKVKKNVLFSIGNNAILVPKKFFEYYLEKVAMKYIISQECEIVHKEAFNYISCKNSFNVDNFGVVSFIMGKNTFKISAENLFKQTDNGQAFLMYSYNTFDQYMFGIPFFTEYLSVFDKEKNEVGLLKYSTFIS